MSAHVARPAELDVPAIGDKFSNLYARHHRRTMGPRARVIAGGPDAGSVWYAGRGPGAPQTTAAAPQTTAAAPAR